MAGPLATIFDVYKNETMSKKVVAQPWIVFISAFSLVVGLATYGYNITRAMGTQMVCLTPSRGFAAELATALVILVSSQWVRAFVLCAMYVCASACDGVGHLFATGGVSPDPRTTHISHISQTASHIDRRCTPRTHHRACPTRVRSALWAGSWAWGCWRGRRASTGDLWVRGFVWGLSKNVNLLCVVWLC
jgi:hypothetical protein